MEVNIITLIQSCRSDELDGENVIAKKPSLQESVNEAADDTGPVMHEEAEHCTTGIQ